jgi:hypothetical protein
VAFGVQAGTAFARNSTAASRSRFMPRSAAGADLGAFGTRLEQTD